RVSVLLDQRPCRRYGEIEQLGIWNSEFGMLHRVRLKPNAFRKFGSVRIRLYWSSETCTYAGNVESDAAGESAVGVLGRVGSCSRDELGAGDAGAARPQTAGGGARAVAGPHLSCNARRGDVGGTCGGVVRR